MYKMRIFVAGNPGWFEYEVSTYDQAINHFSAISENGYRRVNDRGQFEWYAPSLLKAIKIVPMPGARKLDSQYPDKFVRT